MDQILNKVGSYWIGKRANKEINSVGDDINVFLDRVSTWYTAVQAEDSGCDHNFHFSLINFSVSFRPDYLSFSCGLILGILNYVCGKH
ncbi:hypothetical protein KY290_005552 [Solanum tuberosum]|uniref:Uncharacterized protein n=1 Tax=Solanum tuberosum TaxID=4113 RepID=A0ABQ7WEH0_SOLTU|nr:hypothetical protein KY290_005552 [Solanum tuberosum]